MVTHPRHHFFNYLFQYIIHTENIATLKITLKNNIKKKGFTENYTEKRPLLFRNAKKRLPYHIFIQTKYHFKSLAIHQLHQICYNHTENLIRL